ncbi:MAG: hypothetical protein R3B84_02405 [Zavarzinella sp.]
MTNEQTNSSTRMTNAELRKRLLVSPKAAPVVFPEETADSEPVARGGTMSSGLFMRPTSQVDLDLMGEVESPPVRAEGPSRVQLPSTKTRPNNVLTPKSDPLASAAADPDCALFGNDMDAEIMQLREANAELEGILEEMRNVLHEAETQEHTYQQQLQIKEAEIAELKEIAAQLQYQLDNKPKSRLELEQMADEIEKDSAAVERERRMLAEEREQLRQDEEALEKQMRDMEVQMARERAMIARQETELKRLSTEIQRELEAIQHGDGNLRDRLAVFQRRHSDVMSGQPGTHSQPPHVGGSGHSQVAPPMAEDVPEEQPKTKRPDSTGLLRKIFRGNQ